MTFVFDTTFGKWIDTGTYPKFVYVSKYVTAFFLLPLPTKDLENDLDEDK